MHPVLMNVSWRVYVSNSHIFEYKVERLPLNLDYIFYLNLETPYHLADLYSILKNKLKRSCPFI